MSIISDMGSLPQVGLHGRESVPPEKSFLIRYHGATPLDRVIQVVRQTWGRDLSPFDEAFLVKSLQRRLAATAIEIWAAYLDRLASDRAEADALSQSLNIGYSEFFRSPLVFSLLEQVVLPSLLGSRGTTAPAELRIWSAGCAAGQEAWSVAILLEDLNAGRERPVPFRILATDVSEAGLVVARQGTFDSETVQNVRLKHIRKYFTVAGESYQIAPALAACVDFSTYDLLDERTVCPPASLYGDFDLILCCNLLFYYRPDIRRRLLDKLRQALSPRGYLVTGETERDILMSESWLHAVAPPAAVFQKVFGL